MAPSKLPPIPLVEGPLAIDVVYPPPDHVIQSPDSNFVLGSIGNGLASLTINGERARVYPNGSFLAFVSNPPADAPQYELVATLGADTVRSTQPVGVRPSRPELSLIGPLVVDSASVSPSSGGLALRDSEPVRVSVRAPANASVWVASPQGTYPLTNAAPGARLDPNFFVADIAAAALRDSATLYLARDVDTVRLALAAVAPADLDPPRLVSIGEAPVQPDTDRVIVGRPTPGGTYKWFFLPGTIVQATGSMSGFTRVRLDHELEVWVADSDLRPLPPGSVIPRRVTSNARVRSAPGWVDLVIPIGERPAYFVQEGGNEISIVLYGTRANTDIINYAGNDTLVRTVEWEQVTQDRARYTVRLREPLYGYLVMWEDGALVLRVRRPPSPESRHPLEGMTIVVDPGHPPIGATGPTRFWEPEATLQIGQRLQRILEDRGANVVMTRTTADPVALGDRPIVARRADGNAFVSIHLNAYPDGVNIFTARNGSGTYFFRALSEPLARDVQRGLVARMGLPNLGVNYDNLAVVRPTWMPSILTEGAFIIVPEQEAALRTPEFQERYARGIADGLEEYFRQLAERR